MTDGGEDGVDGVTFGTLQEAAGEVAVGFHVTDHRLDGAAAFQFASDGWRQAVFLAGDEHPFGVRGHCDHGYPRST